MFSEEDTEQAVRVTPLDFADEVEGTLIGHLTRKQEKQPRNKQRLLATAVVIFSTMLLTAPKGVVLSTVISAANSAKQLWSKPEKTSAADAVGKSGASINANNSNVQSVQIINNGGVVSVTPQRK
ncbi:MAG: hypothetical protein QOD32_2525 [Pyrinomonadaceae bacterium]|jgi:hypothetical protein|nr:hypothetical protein [Pyrinomonadaceae bacterium]